MYKTLIKPLFKDINIFIADVLFPISCLSCGAEGDFICADCKMTIKTLENQRCIVCQRHTPFGLTHPGCQTPHGADGLISFYDYHDPKVADIIIKGKYSFLPDAFRTLGGMMSAKLKLQFLNFLRLDPHKTDEEARQAISNFILVPIPLSCPRQRWRGFNQSKIICESLSSELNLPCYSVLVRCKTTKVQKDVKKREDRIKNVRDAFELPKGADINGKNILLVDDVTTTGATLLEAAKVLKRNGANKVICLTVARD